ncbi:MAG TPA: hypothetical protein VMF66_09185 [Candidatus Acidoferrum sp.]|nr:hypothetical protein [Candidatus Acidoferrum sp.]
MMKPIPHFLILILLALTISCVSCSRTVAQSALKDPPEKELAVLELGVAPSWSVKDGTPSVGPTIAAEVTPIEHWLEVEAGVTPLFAAHSTEWDTDLLFKKPWTLSRKAEFMCGLGPEWIRRRENGVTTNSAGAEAALDFMFWPARKHKFGWYLEPAYDYDFGRGHEQSVGISGGLLISIP